jgi:uncharacterized protein (TIGR02001 family)
VREIVIAMPAKLRTTAFAAAAASAASVLALCVAAPASAQDLSFTAGVTVVSDYLFRGISQTNAGPALQGSFEAALDTGFAGTSVYAGLFASNVKFVVEGQNGTYANREFDYTGGVRGKIGDVTWDLGFVYYDYDREANPFGSFNYDFYEVQAKLGYDFGFAAVTGQLNHTPSFQTDGKKATYAAIAATVPLPFEVTAFGRVGKQWVEVNAAYGTPDYIEYQVGVQREILFGVIGAVSFNDTNISEGDLQALGSFIPHNSVDPSVVFSLSRTFTF